MYFVSLPKNVLRFVPTTVIPCSPKEESDTLLREVGVSVGSVDGIRLGVKLGKIVGTMDGQLEGVVGEVVGREEGIHEGVLVGTAGIVVGEFAI